ncbi:hypothetical protein ACFFHM_25045 [Halalkalibacter kiskunsagensis]|uniref:Uncharacterized protein n=1 Tax=Halalkalibacter kiskunsagensis TaxID=1548599 RepID=A0ABV6KL34_9BACI
MEALILLLLSVCLLSLYGLIYVSVRLAGNIQNEEKKQFRNSFLTMLILLLCSGAFATLLLISS